MNQTEQVRLMTDKMAKFVGYIGKKLPDDVIAKLSEMRKQETSPLAKTLYDTMFRNQELAVQLDRDQLPGHRRAAVLGEVRNPVPPDRRSGSAAEGSGGEGHLRDAAAPQQRGDL